MDPDEDVRSLEGCELNKLELLLDVSGSNEYAGQITVAKTSLLDMLGFMRQ